jgi:hypothetical protein
LNWMLKVPKCLFWDIHSVEWVKKESLSCLLFRGLRWGDFQPALLSPVSSKVLVEICCAGQSTRVVMGSPGETCRWRWSTSTGPISEIVTASPRLPFGLWREAVSRRRPQYAPGLASIWYCLMEGPGRPFESFPRLSRSREHRLRDSLG